MGFFSGVMANLKYAAALKECGVDPYKLPTSLTSLICGLAKEQYETTSSVFRDYSRTVSIDFVMSNTGALTALCVLGPTNFSRFDGNYGVSWSGAIVDATQQWKKGGFDSSVETRIIKAISDAGYLHEEFADKFNVLLRS